MKELAELKKLWEQGYIFFIGGVYGFDPYQAEDFEEVEEEYKGFYLKIKIDKKQKEVYFEYMDERD